MFPGNETVINAVPFAFAVTTPYSSTVAILVSLEVYVRFPAFGGFNEATIVPFSPTIKLKDVVLRVILVGIGPGFSPTVTITVLFSAGRYCPLPLNETVINAVPFAFAVTVPFLSTVAMFVSLDVYVRFPASGGFSDAIIVPLSPIIKFNDVVLSVILVGIAGFSPTVTVSVLFSAAA